MDARAGPRGCSLLGVGPHQAGDHGGSTGRLTPRPACDDDRPVAAERSGTHHPVPTLAEDRETTAQLLARTVLRRPDRRRGELGIRPQVRSEHAYEAAALRHHRDRVHGMLSGILVRRKCGSGSSPDHGGVAPTRHRSGTRTRPGHPSCHSGGTCQDRPGHARHRRPLPVGHRGAGRRWLLPRPPRGGRRRRDPSGGQRPGTRHDRHDRPSRPRRDPSSRRGAARRRLRPRTRPHPGP